MSACAPCRLVLHSPWKFSGKPYKGISVLRLPLQQARYPGLLLGRWYTNSREPNSTNNTETKSRLKRNLNSTLDRATAPSPSSQPFTQLPKVKEIREDLWTLPNILTLSRLAAAPVIGALVIQGHSNLALGLFAYSCVTDYLDGYIARKYNLQSVAGSVIDPLADKCLLVTLAACLGISGDIPMYMTVIILGRDILLGLSAFYYRYISLPAPLTFKRYWDFSIPSAEVRPTTISKYNTFLQMIYLGSSVVMPSLLTTEIGTSMATQLQFGLTGLGYIVASTTIASGLSYVFSKDAVKIVGGRKR